MPENLAPPKHNKIKIALIPVLSVALLWMVLGRTGGDDSQPAASATVPVVAQAGQPSRAQAAVREIPKPERNWPGFELQDLLAHNPFTGGLDPEANAGEQDDSQAAAQELGVLAVKVYLTSRRGTVALVDGHVVREGDVLEDGRLVAKLTPDFAVITRAP